MKMKEIASGEGVYIPSEQTIQSEAYLSTVCTMSSINPPNNVGPDLVLQMILSNHWLIQGRACGPFLSISRSFSEFLAGASSYRDNPESATV